MSDQNKIIINERILFIYLAAESMTYPERVKLIITVTCRHMVWLLVHLLQCVLHLRLVEATTPGHHHHLLLVFLLLLAIRLIFIFIAIRLFVHFLVDRYSPDPRPL